MLETLFDKFLQLNIYENLAKILKSEYFDWEALCEWKFMIVVKFK